MARKSEIPKQRVLNLVLINLSILCFLIIGKELDIRLLLNISIVLLWITVISSVFFNKELLVSAIVKENPNLSRSVSPIIDITYGLIVVYFLIFYDYIVLSFFYLIHIFLLYELYIAVNVNKNKLKVNKIVRKI